MQGEEKSKYYNGLVSESKGGFSRVMAGKNWGRRSAKWMKNLEGRHSGINNTEEKSVRGEGGEKRA